MKFLSNISIPMARRDSLRITKSGAYEVILNKITDIDNCAIEFHGTTKSEEQFRIRLYYKYQDGIFISHLNGCRY